MATQSVSYLAGEDPGTAKANAEYQEALQKMLASLDARQNRMFDPQLLALAEGFLKPTQTGSFGESLGYAAGSLRAAQEKQALEDQKLAEARLGLAGKGLELERQKARERAFEQLARVGAPAAGEAPAEAPGAVPSGALGQPSAPVGADQVAQSVAQAGAGRLAQGVQIAPPDPSFPTFEQFLAAQRLDPSVNAGQAMLKWQELLKGAEVVTEGGMFNRATGRFYSKPGGAPVERKIFDRTFLVSPVNAARLDMAQEQGGDHYKNVATQVLKSMQGVGGTAPRDVTESEIEKVSDIERAKVLATESAKMEVEVPKMLDTALQIRSATDRIIQGASRSPEVFGVFEKPTVVAALGRLIDEGITVGATRINLAGFRPAVTQALLAMSPTQQQAIPGRTQDEKLDTLMRFAGDKAELELLFRAKYLKNQGSISNMETAMIPAMIGSERDSARVVQDKARLLSLRAQFDIKEAEKWNEMSEADPKLTYLQFRKSTAWRKMRDEYTAALRREFSSYIPRDESSGASAQRPASASTASPAAATSSTSSMRPTEGALRRLDPIAPMR